MMTVVLGTLLTADVLTTREAAASENISRPAVMSFTLNTTDLEIPYEDSSSNSTSSDGADGGWLLDELQLVKVIVLVVVVAILLLSTCTFIFRTFTLFDAKKDEH